MGYTLKYFLIPVWESGGVTQGDGTGKFIRRGWWWTDDDVIPMLEATNMKRRAMNNSTNYRFLL